MSEKRNDHAATENFEFDALEKAVNYRASLIREFAPWLRGRVLEVGAGIGQITSAVARLKGVETLLAIEPELKFCQIFRRLHPQLNVVEGCLQSVSIEPDWDAIICINVLEHIREDETELAAYRRKVAARQGHLCLFVPARQEIYAPIDRDFGHFRRYSKPMLRQRLERAGFHTIRLHYFNLIGYFAWWFNFRLLRKRRFDNRAIATFDRLIFPWASALERTLIRPPFGQSLLAVARAAK